MNRRVHRRQFHRRGKAFKNQRGFSLVEVIIALTILAIIAVPICHAFVTAARTNAKARRLACANAVAENVMEGIDAYSFEDIAIQFGDSVTTDQFLVSTNCDNKGIVSGMVDVEGVQTPGSVMVYQIGGIEEDIYDFDVKITVDSTAYDGDAENPGMNDEELVQLTTYDFEKDYLFTQEKEEEILAYQTLANRSGVHTAAQFEGKVKRTMTIVLKKDSDAMGEYVRVSNSMTYEYVGVEGWLSGEEAKYSKVYPARQYSTEDFLRNMYVCYFPNYASTTLNSQMDQIVIENQDNLEVDVYLLKQIDGTGAELAAKESSYVPTITVMEGGTSGNSKLSFHTNYGENLADGSEIATAKPRYIYRYQNVDGITMEKSDAEAENAIAPEGAMDTIAVNRLYHVTVEVYESGAYGHFADADTSALKKITELTSY